MFQPKRLMPPTGTPYDISAAAVGDHAVLQLPMSGYIQPKPALVRVVKINPKSLVVRYGHGYETRITAKSRARLWVYSVEWQHYYRCLRARRTMSAIAADLRQVSDHDWTVQQLDALDALVAALKEEQ